MCAYSRIISATNTCIPYPITSSITDPVVDGPSTPVLLCVVATTTFVTTTFATKPVVPVDGRGRSRQHVAPCRLRVGVRCSSSCDWCRCGRIYLVAAYGSTIHRYDPHSHSYRTNGPEPGTGTTSTHLNHVSCSIHTRRAQHLDGWSTFNNILTQHIQARWLTHMLREGIGTSPAEMESYIEHDREWKRSWIKRKLIFLMA